MPLSTLIQRSRQPNPSLSEAQAHALLRAHYDWTDPCSRWAVSRT